MVYEYRALVTQLPAKALQPSAMFLITVRFCQPPCRQAYRTIMLSYAGVCSLWIPLLAWMMPSHSFRVGMLYLVRRDWTFEVRLRTGTALPAALASLPNRPPLVAAAFLPVVVAVSPV